ncbi:MAG: hypothetical protein RL211_2029, partial [Pseudomonadota bacterium]
AANYTGTVPVITYTVSDGAGGTDTSTLSLSVTAANDAPVAMADTAIAVEASGVANGTAGSNPAGNVLTNDTDTDTGDSATVSAIMGVSTGTVGGNTAGAYGTLVLAANGSYTYTLNNSLPAVQALRTSADTLTDIFTYTVQDAAGATSSTTLTVTIQGANDAPVAVPKTATLIGGTPLVVNAAGGLLLNSVDVDGGALSISAFTVAGVPGPYTLGSALSIPGVGSLTINADGSYSFTPVANYTGTVPVIGFTVSDGAGATASSTLSLAVTPGLDGLLPPSGQTPPPAGWSVDALPQPAATVHVLQAVAAIENLRVEQALTLQAPLRGEAMGRVSDGLLFVQDGATGDVQRMIEGSTRGQVQTFTAALHVQHAVRYQSLVSEPNLFVQHAVRASQLESMVRAQAGAQSMNAMDPQALADPFALGAINLDKLAAQCVAGVQSDCLPGDATKQPEPQEPVVKPQAQVPLPLENPSGADNDVVIARGFRAELERQASQRRWGFRESGRATSRI